MLCRVRTKTGTYVKHRRIYMVSSMSSLEKTSLFVWFFPSCCTPRDLRKTSVDLHGFFDVHPWENSVFVRSLCCVVPLTRTCCTFDSQQHKEQTLGWNQAAIKVFSQNITKVIYNSGTRLDFFTFRHISPLSKESTFNAHLSVIKTIKIFSIRFSPKRATHFCHNPWYF